MSTTEVKSPSVCKVRGAHFKWLQPRSALFAVPGYYHSSSLFKSLACRVRKVEHSTLMKHVLTGGACRSCGPAGSSACRPGGSHC